jgi:hypothetical protein
MAELVYFIHQSLILTLTFLLLRMLPFRGLSERMYVVPKSWRPHCYALTVFLNEIVLHAHCKKAIVSPSVPITLT